MKKQTQREVLNFVIVSIAIFTTMLAPEPYSWLGAALLGWYAGMGVIYVSKQK